MKGTPSVSTVLKGFAVVSAFSLLSALAQEAGAQTCGSATIWTSPPTVHYGTVIRDSEGQRSEPNFTVFIELPDGSAADIDAGSLTLNGFAAVEHPGAVGDANHNGIGDVMVKFNRRALITADGLVTVTGRTKTGGCFGGNTTVEISCLPTSVERSDYFIDFTTSIMPDHQFSFVPARLDVHRVKPVFPAGCPKISPTRALVLVHGRSVPASAAFDLRYRDYSLMERLALRGIDTFAANHLGFGFSSLVGTADPLANPCNASLPQCSVPTNSTCTPKPGECDCQGLPATQRMDQQGSAQYLNPNPLTGRCAEHTSNTRFERVTDQVAELDLVIDDALAKSGIAKVHLLGLSNGGHTVGKYLGDDPAHRAKIAGVIFLDSSGFGGVAGLDEQTSTSWPLGLIDQADVMDNFNIDIDPAVCPGQLDPGIPDALWAATKARDPIGSQWGPQPGGLSRFPIVSRFLWRADVASNIDLPALVVHGLRDDVVLPARGVEIWSSSPLQDPETKCTSDAQCDAGYACRSFPGPARCRLNNRTLVQLACASHALLWETCSGEGCVDPHKAVQKRVGDWVLSGK